MPFQWMSVMNRAAMAAMATTRPWPRLTYHAEARTGTKYRIENGRRELTAASSTPIPATMTIAPAVRMAGDIRPRRVCRLPRGAVKTSAVPVGYNSRRGGSPMRSTRSLLAVALAVVMGPGLMAQSHVASQQALDNAVQQHVSATDQDRETVRLFLQRGDVRA